jgi:RNA polymerase sigma factor (sigma-70 family)
MSQHAIRAALHAAAGAGVTDAELLARFAATRDEAAFELLVWRHAGFVQRVCRAVLRDHHAAEDAAQATFLALARKAHAFAGHDSAVGWLYRVARRVAVRAAKSRAKRALAPAELDRLPAAPAEAGAAPDEVAALCAEIDRLPERYRVPVLLCFFEGLTHAEAARRTGWPVGTVAGRLARAKELLSRRLSRKGVGVAGVVLGLPAAGFVGGTAQAAVAFATKGVVPGVEPNVIQLAEGALKTMTNFTWKVIAAAVAVVCAASGVTATVIGFGPPAPPPAPPAVAPPPAAVAAPVPPKKEGERVANAAQRARSQNNLKQILIALHAYHDSFDQFPQNIADKNGKPLLSWRVAILPFIEQENLYREFKLDEPWDSEHNKKLLAKMPDVYRVGFEPKGEAKTYYQGFAGPGTLFEPGKKVKIGNILDGTSNTLAVAEAGPPVEWTRPADIPYAPKNAVKLEGPFSNVLIAAAADGSTHPFRRDLDDKTMRRLIEVADGEVEELDKLHGEFPLTREDMELARKLIAENEKLMKGIADQMKQQQELILELAKHPNAKVANAADLEQLGKMNLELTFGLVALKKRTDELKQQLEEARRAPAKPEK